MKMPDKIYDDQAWVCPDCYQLEGCGDLSSFDYWYGAEADTKRAELYANINANLAPHAEVRTLDGSLWSSAHNQLHLTLGWFAENHSSECTEDDRDTEHCDCETSTFRSDDCASCGQYMQGATMHAATIWESES
jgi:hypothetical protein